MLQQKPMTGIFMFVMNLIFLFQIELSYCLSRDGWHATNMMQNIITSGVLN